MKKIFYLASIAALAFSSCAKDNATEPSMGDIKGGAKITAAMAADDTRTSLEKVDGKYEFRWSAGDQLGVYGVGGGLNNAAFVLNNDSDGKAVGVFASQSTELKADKQYVAVYPRFQTSLFTEVSMTSEKIAVPGTKSDKAYYIEHEDVKMSIPTFQKYQPASFYTQTVPAVSSEFYVNANGSASLSMQPVVDYLFVNIQSTEPIETLTLKLYTGTSNYLPISGKGNLERYILGDEYRYVLKALDTDVMDYITLQMDESSDAVACHDANTYVFAVPGGILGMDNNVKAKIWVNDDEKPAFTLTSTEGDAFYSNATLNYALDADGDKFYRLDEDGDWAMRQENTVFWANALEDPDKDKVYTRSTFTYNPNGDVIIKNEVELLRYINQYNIQNGYLVDGIEKDEDVQYADKDAFLCEDGSFDFSLKNMMELATEYENTEFEPYIAAYLADVEDGGGFPCFVKYTNNFIGNGAVIENIEQPLLEMAGIFGGGWYYTDDDLYAITPMETRGGEYVDSEFGKTSITNVTFANIKAATYTQGPNVLGNGLYDAHYMGQILAGNLGSAAVIKNVTVKDSWGSAILGGGTVAQYNGLTIEGVSEMGHIFKSLYVESKLDLTETWNVVSGVENSVFHQIIPMKNVKGKVAIHEIIIPEGGAEAYATLTEKVDVKSSPSAVAVLIDGVSYWTGDLFEVWKDDDNNCVNKKATPKVYYVRYAEELAGGNGEHVQLTRDMDLNFANLQWDNENNDGVNDTFIHWASASFASLNGAEHTVSNVNMHYEGAGTDVNVAPFYAPVVKNITLDGVNITNITPNKTNVVAEYISGVTANAETVSNVTVNDLVISAYRADGTNNTEANYSTSYPVKIGWVSASATDAEITDVTVNGVESNVKGIAGLVAMNVIETSSKFDNASVQNVDAINTSIEKFAQFNSEKTNYNEMGTAVGLVVNEAGRKADIKFVDCGAPVFLYDAPSTLTVVYNNVEKGSFKNAPAK